MSDNFAPIKTLGIEAYERIGKEFFARIKKFENANEYPCGQDALRFSKTVKAYKKAKKDFFANRTPNKETPPPKAISAPTVDVIKALNGKGMI